MFYTYVHRKASNGEIFYIGKGAGNRLDRFNNRNNHWHKTVAKHGLISEKVLETELEDEALELERFLISEIGRRDLGDGPLVNMTDGGDGVSGHKHSSDSRSRMSESHRGVPLSKKHRDNMLASVREANKRPEVKQRRSAIANKLWADPEHRRKQRAGMIVSLASPECRAAMADRARDGWADPEVRKRRRNGLKRYMQTRMIPIRNVDTGEVFANATAAAESVGRTKGAVQSAIKRGGRCAGCKWEMVV